MIYDLASSPTLVMFNDFEHDFTILEVYTYIKVYFFFRWVNEETAGKQECLFLTLDSWKRNPRRNLSFVEEKRA